MTHKYARDEREPKWFKIRNRNYSLVVLLAQTPGIRGF